ncbi:MAG TPA: hypothetical protein VLD57_02780 [Blastocatellia bacterium]|nr:hypothetical protein [Blastocatellia bacterium]
MNRKYKILLFCLIFVIAAPTFTSGQDPAPALQEVGTYRWLDGCVEDGKVCGSSRFGNGLASLILTVNRVSIDVVLVDTGNLILVATVVGNDTRQPIDVIPDLFSLTSVKEKPRPLKRIDPDWLAKKSDEKKARADIEWMKTALSLSTERVKVETRLSPVPGDYNEVASEPGTSGKEPEPGRANSPKETGAGILDTFRVMALRPVALPARKFASGIVYFEVDKEADHLLLSIPAGGYVFEFPFVRKTQ